MTRSIIGPDGEQQRVTVERDFRNEVELNAFLKQFGDSLNNKATKKSHKTTSAKPRANTTNNEDLIKPPG